MRPETLQFHWYAKAARWARFLAIVGFVITGIMLLASFFTARMVRSTPDLAEINPDLPWMAKIFSWSMPILALVYFLPCFFLFRFAAAAIKAAQYKDELQLQLSFKRLYLFFLYIGVLTIFILAVYVLAFGAIASAALMGLGEQ